MEYLDFGEIRIPYVHRRSKRAKHVRLSIDNEGVVSVVTPWFVPLKKGLEFAEMRREWIVKHVMRMQEKKREHRSLRFEEGAIFSFCGEELPLKIISSSRRRLSLKRDGEFLVLTVPADGEFSEKDARKVCEDFYRRHAGIYLEERSRFFAERLGVRFGSVRIKDQKSRWGSCSSKGNLNYNYRILMAPMEVIDYLVVHEVCHLKEMNHSSRFWALVESLMPDYKRWRKWLKENGAALQML